MATFTPTRPSWLNSSFNVYRVGRVFVYPVGSLLWKGTNSLGTVCGNTDVSTIDLTHAMLLEREGRVWMGQRKRALLGNGRGELVRGPRKGLG